MAAWRTRQTNALAVTHHGWMEMINGLMLAVRRGLISDAASQAALN